jgi:hypothetical protein
MTLPIVAPYVPSYATYTPYITPAEFLDSATGVDVTQLVAGGTVAQNNAALATMIARASSYADGLCYQVLAATTDIQIGEYRVSRQGTIQVPVDNTPLIEVSAISIGRPGAMQALTDLTGVWLRRKVVQIPVMGLSGYGGYGAGCSVTAQVTYVNGWANTTLADSAAAGDSGVAVVNPLGLFPGLTAQIYDGVNTEPVTLAATYIQGSTTVPLAAPLSFGHQAGISLSALPPTVKQAVVLLTTAFIKTRGAEGIVMGAMAAEPRTTEKTEPGGLEEFDLAVDMLAEFKRVR